MGVLTVDHFYSLQSFGFLPEKENRSYDGEEHYIIVQDRY